MASSSSSSALAAVILVLLPLMSVVKGDNTVSPELSPFVDHICDAVECGKGTCKVAVGAPFNFKCECDTNWKRTRLDNETNLEFLPCIIPDCSTNYSCMPAPPPEPSVPYNLSFFDPCYWIYCGEGTCVKNQTYTHSCQCNSGYYNLLNVPAFPCYSQCAIGSECEKLGIKVASSTASSSDNSQATSFLPGQFHWIAIALLSVAMIFFK